MSHPTALTSIELPHHLGGVEQEQRVRPAGDPADLGGGIHQPARRRHPAQPDQFRALVDETGQRGDVDLTAVVITDDDHLGASALRNLEIGKHVAAVLAAAGQDAVARRQRVKAAFRHARERESSASARYVSWIWPVAASAASYPPICASSCNWCVIAAMVGALSRPAPALLR